MASADFGRKKEQFRGKFIENVRPQRKKIQFMTSTKVDMRIGFLTGLFPVRNALTAESNLDHLEVRFFSFAYLYSILMLTFKTFGIYHFATWMFTYQMTGKYLDPSSNFTDFYAGGLAFFFTFCTGPMFHVLGLWRVKKFLKVLKSVNEYDNKYPTDHLAHIQNLDVEPLKPPKRRLLIGVLNSLILTYSSLYSFHTLDSGLAGETKFNNTLSIIPGILETKMTNAACIYTFLGVTLVFNEAGTFFLNAQLFSTSKLLAYHFSNLIPVVCKKQEGGKMNGVTWEAIGRQYNDYLDLFKKYQEFIGPYCTILLAAMMTSTTCMIYFILTGQSQGVQLYTLVVVFGLIRMYGLVDCGERFLRVYRKLVMEVMTSYQAHPSFDKEEKTDMKRVVKLVTMSKVELSASGFFVVCRRNITSIASVIITYIVVLLQFNNTDARNQAMQKEALCNSTEFVTTLRP